MIHRLQLQHTELTVTTHSSWRRCTCKVIGVPSTSTGFRLKSVPTVALVSALNSLLQNWLTRQVLPVLREDRKDDSKAGNRTSWSRRVCYETIHLVSAYPVSPTTMTLAKILSTLLSACGSPIFASSQHSRPPPAPTHFAST